MTIQVRQMRGNYGKSKQTLQDALNQQPAEVYFDDPSIMNPRSFSGASIQLGESFPVVMDHPKRMRFASVQRLANGTFRVK